MFLRRFEHWAKFRDSSECHTNYFSFPATWCWPSNRRWVIFGSLVTVKACHDNFFHSSVTSCWDLMLEHQGSQEYNLIKKKSGAYRQTFFKHQWSTKSPIVKCKRVCKSNSVNRWREKLSTYFFHHEHFRAKYQYFKSIFSFFFLAPFPTTLLEDFSQTNRNRLPLNGVPRAYFRQKLKIGK